MALEAVVGVFLLCLALPSLGCADDDGWDPSGYLLYCPCMGEARFNRFASFGAAVPDPPPAG